MRALLALSPLSARAVCLLVGAACLCLAATGCQSAAEVWAAVAPFVSDTLATTMATQIGDLVNQAAKGQPIGPDEIALLTDTFRGAMTGVAEAAADKATAGRGWDLFLAGAGGGLTSAGASSGAPKMLSALVGAFTRGKVPA